MKKTIGRIVLIAVLCFVALYSYADITARSNFNIKQVSDEGEKDYWTDNTQYNAYDIKFGRLNGNDIKEVKSKKDTFSMKINCDITSGEFHLKIYNDKKVLFQKNTSVNETIEVDKSNSKNVKIEISGNKAKGHVKIKIS